MVTGAYVIGGKTYRFDKDGKMVSTLSNTVKDGWLQIGSDWAYIQNGQRVVGMATIGNAIYAFDNRGLMLKNRLYGGGGQGLVYLGSDGKAASYTGWKQINGFWYYFNENHFGQAGFITVSGKTYFCNYPMVTGYFAYGDQLLSFGSDGVLVGVVNTQNGWVQNNGNSFYVKDGAPCSRGIYTIDGKTYGFDYSGKLVKNDAVRSYSDGVYYWVGSDGTVSTTAGWKQDSFGYYYYNDATGRCLTGIQVINGSTYYFNENGEWIH